MFNKYNGKGGSWKTQRLRTEGTNEWLGPNIRRQNKMICDKSLIFSMNVLTFDFVVVAIDVRAYLL